MQRMLIDIDGPEISLALASAGEPSRLQELRTYGTSDFPTATDCIMHYAKDVGIDLAGSKCVMVVSGAMIGDSVKIARCPWIISITGFRYLFQSAPLFLNDTAAMLWAGTQVSPMTHRPLGAYGLPNFAEGGKWLAINYFRGLGAAVLISDAAGSFVHIESEAGHCGFAPVDDDEQILCKNLARVKKPVSWERALHTSADDDAWQDTQYYRNSSAVTRKRAEILGSFVGDIVLAAGTWSGVMLFKTAAIKMQSQDNISLFLKRMENRANFALQLRKVPVWAVESANINLVGAAIYVDAIGQ
jgi:glucokinase